VIEFEFIVIKQSSIKDQSIIIVNAIKYGNELYLQNDEDQQIFNTLSALDVNTLKVLVDYYSNVEPKVGDLFNT